MSFPFGTFSNNTNTSNNNNSNISTTLNTNTASSHQSNLFNTNNNNNAANTHSLNRSNLFPFNTNNSNNNNNNNIQGLDANDNKEESKNAEMAASTSSLFANFNNNSDSLYKSQYMIKTDGIIPACDTTIHWTISQRSIEISRNNLSAIKCPKKIIISPSGRTFIVYFDPGIQSGFANNNQQRRYSTIIVQEIQTKQTGTNSFGWGVPQNGTFSVNVKIFDPPQIQQNVGDINNTSHWKIQNHVNHLFVFPHKQNPVNNSLQSSNKRIQLFASNTLNTKIIDGLFRLQIYIEIPATVITSIVYCPTDIISPINYLKYKNNEQYIENEQQLLGITRNKNYNASYKWYELINDMIQQQRFGDIEIICNDNKRWRAHKDILSNFSPVFKAMLESEFQESLQNNIELKEENSITMKYILMYCYMGTIPNDIDLDEIAPNILKAADKYSIVGLSMLLFEFIKTRINHKNVAMALILCKLYKGSECKESVVKLQKYVLKYLSKLKNMKKVLKSKSFEILFTQHPDLVKNVLLATNSINLAKKKNNNTQNNDDDDIDNIDDLDDEILYFQHDDSDNDDD